ncbi:hypothetical protein PT276_05630 [Orbaceae bacterium ESL0721]|nr:hypothetical protein [Orbaceae bacterium ESL0721]
MIDEIFVRKIDDYLINDDVMLHARPAIVCYEWIKQYKQNINIFDVFTETQLMNSIMVIYKKFYPNGNFSLPPVLSAGVALRDNMYPVKINIGFGNFVIDPLDCIDIPKNQLEYIFGNYPEQGWKAFYGVCDLWDFGYGVDDIIKLKTPAEDFLNNARSSMVATSYILLNDFDLNSAIQTSCLSAELSLKAALLHLGMNEKDLKKIGKNGHNLVEAAKLLILYKSTRNDEKLLKACNNFPNYVESRYGSNNYPRIYFMELAMRSQFVAAEAVRRISNRNMAGDMEIRPDCPLRPEL